MNRGDVYIRIYQDKGKEVISILRITRVTVESPDVIVDVIKHIQDLHFEFGSIAKEFLLKNYVNIGTLSKLERIVYEVYEK